MITGLSEYAFKVGDRVAVSGLSMYEGRQWGTVQRSPTGALEVWLDGEIRVVDTTLRINISDEPVAGGFSLDRCECGSGSHVRGPGHAHYCGLLEP